MKSKLCPCAELFSWYVFATFPSDLWAQIELEQYSQTSKRHLTFGAYSIESDQVKLSHVFMVSSHLYISYSFLFHTLNVLLYIKFFLLLLQFSILLTQSQF